MAVPRRDNSPSFVHSPLWSVPLRVLLIQARESERMVEQERQCFAERCFLPRECFQFVNVVRGDRLSAVDLDRTDAMLIGGAGAYSATDDYEWTGPLFGLVRRAVDRGLPVFGSCWGHQVIVRALGGTVVYDPDHAELGCHWVERTEAGASDPLFHRFPRRFRANMGHHDRVVELPRGATELARNETPFQAFRLDGRPVYGTQFHSELDAERERERILVYREHYRDALPDRETVKQVLNNLADTTEVDYLLYDFLTTYVARAHPPEVRSTLEPPAPLRASSTDGMPHSVTGRRLPGAQKQEDR